MDTTPLYCAEQIVIPEELAEILKVYTKAVIRAQPNDIYTFSAQYFENLTKTKGRVTKKQLALLHKELSAIEDKSHIDSELISAHCGVLKISSEVTSAVLKKLDAKPDWEEFVALASTLLGQDFISSVEAMFDIFGGEEPGKHDPAISAEFIKCIEHALSDAAQITFPEFYKLPYVQKLVK